MASRSAPARSRYYDRFSDAHGSSPPRCCAPSGLEQTPIAEKALMNWRCPDTGIARNGCRFSIFSCMGPDTYGWKPRWFDSDPPESAYPTEKLGRSRELEGFFRYLLEVDLRSRDQGGTERCGSAGGRSGNRHCCGQTDGGVQIPSAKWF